MRLHEAVGQTMPAGVMWSMEAARPSKTNADWQKRQRRERRAASLKRMESGIWLSSGKISCVALEVEEELMEYLRVSRPRHSANCRESVPGMGAQRRSIGGNICL